MGNTHMKRKSVHASQKIGRASIPESMSKRFQERYNSKTMSTALDLCNKGVDDQMVPELADWIIKLDGKIKELK